jgi:dipeptidyl aminopeptidase/acylaminoacyl peptidase
MILAYPVISFVAPYSHRGSANNLLGENADPKLLAELSNELHVTAQTPPTFLFSTDADTVVPSENSVAFYLALRKAGVPAEMHIFEKGPHGVGLDLGDPALGEWPTLLANWMRGRGLLQNQK